MEKEPQLLYPFSGIPTERRQKRKKLGPAAKDTGKSGNNIPEQPGKSGSNQLYMDCPFQFLWKELELGLMFGSGFSQKAL